MVYREGRAVSHEKLIEKSVYYFTKFIRKNNISKKLGHKPILLELGSDNGFALKKFRDKGFNVIGIDLEPHNVFNVPIIQGDWNDLNLYFEDDKFDCVFWNHGINQCLNPVLILQKINNVMKKGGYIFLALLHGYFKYAQDVSKGNFSLFTPLFLNSMMNFCGFERVKSELRCFRGNRVEIFYIGRKI